MPFKIKRGDFYRLTEKYVPLPCQEMEEHSWRSLTRMPMNTALFGRKRFFAAIRCAAIYPKSPVILDMGVYPGTLLCLLDDLLRQNGYVPVLLGTGLRMSPEFAGQIKRKCGADLFTVNLDPGNHDFKDKRYPCNIPLPDASVDIVFATEIMEHLVSPAHMFSEAFRLLRKNGRFIVTTPNVSRIGSVLKLLTGGTNSDTLIRPGYSDPSDEWRPHFREYSMGEVETFLRKAGFEIGERGYFMSGYEFVKRDLKQKMIDLVKLPFVIVPHLRDAVLAVGIKNHD